MPVALAEGVEDDEVEGWVTGEGWGLLFTGLVPAAPHEQEPAEEGAAFISAHLAFVSRCHSLKLTRSNAAALVQQWSPLNFNSTVVWTNDSLVPNVIFELRPDLESL